MGLEFPLSAQALLQTQVVQQGLFLLRKSAASQSIVDLTERDAGLVVDGETTTLKDWWDSSLAEFQEDMESGLSAWRCPVRTKLLSYSQVRADGDGCRSWFRT